MRTVSGHSPTRAETQYRWDGEPGLSLAAELDAAQARIQELEKYLRLALDHMASGPAFQHHVVARATEVLTKEK